MPIPQDSEHSQQSRPFLALVSGDKFQLVRHYSQTLRQQWQKLTDEANGHCGLFELRGVAHIVQMFKVSNRLGIHFCQSAAQAGLGKFCTLAPNHGCGNGQVWDVLGQVKTQVSSHKGKGCILGIGAFSRLQIGSWVTIARSPKPRGMNIVLILIEGMQEGQGRHWRG